jgi:hypothetical protein
MLSNLLKTPFTEQLLPRVRDFCCGRDPWEIEVSDWIKAPFRATPRPGALDAMTDPERPCEVWLYGTVQGDLVGFGSIGWTEWRWPRPNNDPRVPISIIPYIGVGATFQGKPERFGSQILSDLRAEALGHPARMPLIGLFVDVRNNDASRFYEKEHFKPFGKPITDPDTGNLLQRMILDLSQ